MAGFALGVFRLEKSSGKLFMAKAEKYVNLQAEFMAVPGNSIE